MRPAICFAALLAVTACAHDLEFADWMIPVPEGARIIEYEHVPLDERSDDAVRLVEDLVIGNDLNNLDTFLYEPYGVVAASNGNIFVGDPGVMHIKMFSSEGKYLKTLGQEGQGPGEFARLSGITIAGDVLLVNDTGNRRFSQWTLDGEFIANHAPTSRVTALSMQGLADGSFLSHVSIDRDADGGSWALVQRTREGEEISSLLEVALPPPPRFDLADIRGALQDSLDEYNNPQLTVTVASGEIGYVSPVVEYQVMAISAAGESLWAMRVAWERASFPEIGKETTLSSWAEMLGDETLSIDGFDWPPRLWAVQSLATDDAGHLFVFLLTEFQGASEEPPDEVMVDVFSPDGEFLAAGIVPSTWSYARGNYVYGIRPDELGEMVMVRYRVEIDGH